MPTAFETEILTLSPVLNWDMSVDINNDIISDGSDIATMTDVPTLGTAGVGPTGAGDVTINPNGAGYYDRNGMPTSTTNDTAGTLIISAIIDTSPAANQALFSCGEKSSGSKTMALHVQTTGNLRWINVTNGFSSNASRNECTTPVALADATYHFLAIRQKADGSTGIEMYVDGTWEAVTETLVGTGTVDDWFGTFATSVTGHDAWRFGRSSSTSATTILDGEISHAAIWDTALSDAQILSLYTTWSGGVSFANKTIRRKGRRLFSPNV